FEGVRKGVEHGGNKSGVPTVNGAIVYDDRFLGKPLVYCGTAGIMPRELNGKGTHVKEIVPGDRIIIAGGRTGKDGIHGATFSSEELHEESPTSAVQIGDPFTQKKLHDFLIEARDEMLYRTLTDNGAGGFSSSVGELAEISGGCEIHLDQALLKTTDIKPWEILLSESQERMTLAVPPESLSQLKTLADKHEVELCDIGTFTDSKNFHILHQGETVGLLSLDFLHDGLPKMELEAEWDQPQDQPADLLPIEDYGEEIKSILSRYNVCSKEAVIRQYDHEVQGGSVVKPLVGVSSEGPGDAAVIRPIECFDGKEGVVISNGICPKFSDSDTYHMAASAIDEAIRNYVAVGGNPKHLAILDNFCWPDPVYEPMKNPDGKHKLAQLVRANKALYETAIGFGTPIISGKDSMKNDCRIGDTKISVPPTLLISAIGKIDDIEKSVSSDLKCPGDYIYVLGTTRNELAGSEYALSNKLKGGLVPKVDVVTAKKLYASLYTAISLGLVVSCHDCSDGGLAVALAEVAFGGGLGVSISLSSVPCESAYEDTVVLFSETNSRFVISVAPDLAEQFEEAMKGCVYGRVGEVREDTMFVVNGVEGSLIVSEDIRELKKAWKRPLSEGESV
ncbi:MAG: AIR synthase-related protein, partial [Chlamydiota bacterium]|nr:AIR synthase-related protein [Chlamydiota bacterium]